MKRLLVNPFCARLKIKSRASLSLVLSALERILYMQLSNEIGCQFVILVVSPFLGISFRRPDLKVGVSFFFSRMQPAQRWSGTLKKRQYFFMKQLLIPSMPDALLFASEIETSSSKIVRSSSSRPLMSSGIMLLVTIGLAHISGPKKCSMQPCCPSWPPPVSLWQGLEKRV